MFLPECVFVYHLCACCPWKTEEGLEYPETGVKNACELLCICCETNLSSQEE